MNRRLAPSRPARRFLPLAAALALSAGLTACHRVEPQPEVVRAVKLMTVGGESDKHTQEYAGVIAARTESRLGFRVAGKLTQRAVDVGQRVQAGQVLAINEYMHPRVREICETLPGGLGRWLERTDWARKLVEARTQKGRVIQTSSLRGYLMLAMVAYSRRWRLGTIRYADENRRIEDWLRRIAGTASSQPELALEMAQCQRLVKGYSDTHERGVRNYETVMDAVQRAGANLAPATLREWRDAALADEHGNALRAALDRYSFA